MRYLIVVSFLALGACSHVDLSEFSSPPVCGQIDRIEQQEDPDQGLTVVDLHKVNKRSNCRYPGSLLR